MFRYKILPALFLALVVPTLNAYAHHSDAPHFHMDQNDLHHGVVSEFKFVNPHAYVYFDKENDDGSVESWRCEMPAAITLSRQDWTAESLRPGQQITIQASPARREARHCYVNSFILEDGTVIPRADAGPVLIATGVQDQRQLRLENGQPNISGHWVTRPRAGRRERPGQTAAALAAAEEFEYEYDHPALKCESVGILHGWPFGRFINQIIQTDDRIMMVYGYMDLERTIHLDQSEHPASMPHTVAGHSIGRWDGDVLIVDTAEISAGAVHPLSELMHSDQYRVVERFWFEVETRTLVREYVADDPLFFPAPFSGRDEADVSAIPYSPYDCVELSGDNNLRPTR